MKLLKVLPGILAVAGGALTFGTAGVSDTSYLPMNQILSRVMIGLALILAANVIKRCTGKRARPISRSKMSEYSERM